MITCYVKVNFDALDIGDVSPSLSSMMMGLKQMSRVVGVSGLEAE